MAEFIPPQVDPSWRGHISATLRLGLPLIGSQLAFMGLSVTDTIMLGWLGAAPLAAGVLATQLLFVTLIAGSGMAHAVSPIVANALGAGDHRSIRRSVRMAMWGSVIFCILGSWHLWFAEPVFLMLGQKPELAASAQDYLRIALWSLPIALFHKTMRSYLTALEYAGIVLWATVIGLILNAFINYAFIFGSLTLLAEVSLFSISSIMMGWLGVIALAAHGIALQVTSVIFMIPLGLSFAATVRVGRAVGRKDDSRCGQQGCRHDCRDRGAIACDRCCVSDCRYAAGHHCGAFTRHQGYKGPHVYGRCELLAGWCVIRLYSWFFHVFSSRLR